MSNAATPKQIDYIVSLANVRHLSQVSHLVGMSHRQLQRLSKSEASQIIDRLKAR